jgi:hypothetical protein
MAVCKGRTNVKDDGDDAFGGPEPSDGGVGIEVDELALWKLHFAVKLEAFSDFVEVFIVTEELTFEASSSFGLNTDDDNYVLVEAENNVHVFSETIGDEPDATPREVCLQEEDSEDACGPNATPREAIVDTIVYSAVKTAVRVIETRRFITKTSNPLVGILSAAVVVETAPGGPLPGPVDLSTVLAPVDCRLSAFEYSGVELGLSSCSSSVASTPRAAASCGVADGLHDQLSAVQVAVDQPVTAVLHAIVDDVNVEIVDPDADAAIVPEAAELKCLPLDTVAPAGAKGAWSSWSEASDSDTDSEHEAHLALQQAIADDVKAYDVTIAALEAIKGDQEAHEEVLLANKLAIDEKIAIVRARHAREAALAAAAHTAIGISAEAEAKPSAGSLAMNLAMDENIAIVRARDAPEAAVAAAAHTAIVVSAEVAAIDSVEDCPFAERLRRHLRASSSAAVYVPLPAPGAGVSIRRRSDKFWDGIMSSAIGFANADATSQASFDLLLIAYEERVAVEAVANENLTVAQQATWRSAGWSQHRRAARRRS